MASEIRLVMISLGCQVNAPITHLYPTSISAVTEALLPWFEMNGHGHNHPSNGNNYDDEIIR